MGDVYVGMTLMEGSLAAITVSTILALEDLLVPGPRLNIKTVLSTYDDFHLKDKTAVRTSYL